MCGIVGFFDKSVSSQSGMNTLKQMSDTIIHRGPDGEGYFQKNNVFFGHRRLSIIDLEHGQQPFFNDEKDLCLIYNGETYNFKELKYELQSKGHVFHTNSDTEVVLKLYEEYKEEAFLKINGMFALAIYDIKRDKIILARDRHGVKPLYYFYNGTELIFASEIKAILKNDKYNKEIDYEALNEYFSFQNVFSDRTLFKDIKKLDHGKYITFNISSNKLQTFRYWDYNFDSTGWNLNRKDTTELLSETFQQAVKRQMVSDVPIGSYLSGGIDSGAITAVLANNIDRLSTFTCGFDMSQVSGIELDFDERARAEIISGKFFTNHYETVLNSKDLEWCINKVMYHLDEPILGMSYPNYYVSELAGKFVKVVFSGTGGDELFGGYPWRYYHTTHLGKGKENYTRSYYNYWQRLVDDKEKGALFNSSIAKKINIDYPYESFKNILSGFNGSLDTEEDYINKSLYLESKTFMQGLFCIDDKLNMSHSVESRVPFLDNDLVNLAMKIPAKYKINNIKNIINFDENNTYKERYIESSDGKAILRESFENILPLEITQYKKQGFSSPEQSWFKNDRKEFMYDILNDKDSMLFEVINKKYVETKLDEHLSGKVNNRLFIWSLISLDSWLKSYWR